MTNLTDLSQEDKDLKMMPIFQSTPHLSQREQAGQLDLIVAGPANGALESKSTCA